jgi:hypothetical protein
MGSSLTAQAIRTQLAEERAYLAAARIAALAGIDRLPGVPENDGDGDQGRLRGQELLADVLEALALLLSDAPWQPEPNDGPRISARLPVPFRRSSPDRPA